MNRTNNSGKPRTPLAQDEARTASVEERVRAARRGIENVRAEISRRSHHLTETARRIVKAPRKTLDTSGADTPGGIALPR